jgi:conjugal transfer mating pair stabilization protein TraG
MDFTIYVLGDVRLFADTINGIAMMFQVASGERIDLWASNTNSMGLGMGALLGMLIALVTLIYNTAFKRNFDLATLVIPMVLYICMTVPKVTVNIVDGYYRDGAQSVANVPVGLAIPFSIISSVVFTATEKLETVFSVPSNGTFTKITEDGFVMPLKMLHAVRYTGLTLRDGYPNINKSIIEITKICLTNNPSFNLRNYQNASNSMGVITAAMTDITVGSRLVKIFPHDERKGKVVSCSQAAPYIENSLKAYMDGTIGDGVPTLIKGDMLKEKNLRTDLEKILSTQNANTGSRNLTNTSTMRVLDDIQNFTKASNDEAIQFLQGTILNPQMAVASQCASGISQRETARCLSYRSSEEQWKEKSAAEASGFLSIMRDGQNLLILLSITLFPIMVLIIAIQGVGGIRVVMSYLLYTISAYMWIPMAAMINWFTQSQLHDEMNKWILRIPAAVGDDQGFLSLANSTLFYDAVSKRLSMANSIMAAVPLISLGVFSGMLWSMNRLVDKMNSQADFNPSMNSPEIIEREPLATVSSSISFDGVSAVGRQEGMIDPSVISKVREHAASVKQAETHLENASMSAAKALGERIATSTDNSELHSLADKLLSMKGITKENNESYEQVRGSAINSLAMLGKAHTISQKTTLSNEDKTSAETALGTNLGISVSKSPFSLGKDLRQKAVASLKETLDQTSTISTEGSLDHQVSGTNTQSQANRQSRSEVSTITNEDALVALANTTTTSSESLINSLNKSRSYQDNLANARTEMNSYQEQQRQATAFSLDTQQLLNLDERTGGKLSRAINSVFEKYEDNPNVRNSYVNSQLEISNMSGASNETLGKQFHALMKGGGSAAANDVAVALGGIGRVLGRDISGDEIGNVGKGAYAARNIAKQETAPAQNLQAPNVTKGGITARANALEQEESAVSDSIDSQAKRKAQKFQGGEDYAAGVLSQGREYMDGLNKAYTEAVRETRFPDKNINGQSADIAPNSTLGGLLANLSTRDGVTYMNDGHELRRIMMIDPKLRSDEDNQIYSTIKGRMKDDGIIKGAWNLMKADVAEVARAYEFVMGKPAMHERTMDEVGNVEAKDITLKEFGRARNIAGTQGRFAKDPVDKTQMTKAIEGVNEAINKYGK